MNEIACRIWKRQFICGGERVHCTWSEFFPCTELVTVHEPLTRLSIMFVVHFEGLFARVIFCIDEDLLALTGVN
jgi:hypothetical protein